MKTSNISFKANPADLVDTLPKIMKPAAKFIAMQEGGSGISNIRFIQDTATNLLPKVIFSRSRADLAETSFLEIAESLLVYYCPTILGEKIFRKGYSKNLPQTLKKLVSKPTQELIKDKKLNPDDLQKLMKTKAAISISALGIPLLEFSLNYIKNLFTLKMFKQADFNNIANLNSNKHEDTDKQEKVKKSAVKNIKLAAGIFAGCLGISAVLAGKKGHSKLLKILSEIVLTPGNKLFPKNAKKAAAVNKYLSLDFADNAGKLGLSRGQLTACVFAGGFGYLGAAKDRGKQNFLEVLFRYPLVGFYVITGSELFEKGFKAILKKTGKCKDLIGKNLEVPTLKELTNTAVELAKKKNTSAQIEFKKLFKQKAVISAVPFAFSIGFMGLFVAGISRAFTKFRYIQEKKKQNILNNNLVQINIDEFLNKISNKSTAQ